MASAKANPTQLAENQLEEPQKFYRQNIVFRSFRSVGLQAMKSVRKNIERKIENNPVKQRMQYRTQLNDSLGIESPVPRRRGYRNKAFPSLNSSAMSSTSCSELETSQIDKTPSKRKLIAKKSNLRKSFRQQLRKRNKRNDPNENLEIDKEIEVVNDCLKDLAKLETKVKFK